MSFNIFEVIGIAILSFGAGVIWIIGKKAELKEKEYLKFKMLKIKFEAANDLIEILESEIKKDIDSRREQ